MSGGPWGPDCGQGLPQSPRSPAPRSRSMAQGSVCLSWEAPRPVGQCLGGCSRCPYPSSVFVELRSQPQLHARVASSQIVFLSRGGGRSAPAFSGVFGEIPAALRFHRRALPWVSLLCEEQSA